MNSAFDYISVGLTLYGRVAIAIGFGLEGRDTLFEVNLGLGAAEGVGASVLA